MLAQHVPSVSHRIKYVSHNIWCIILYDFLCDIPLRVQHFVVFFWQFPQTVLLHLFLSWFQLILNNADVEEHLLLLLVLLLLLLYFGSITVRGWEGNVWLIDGIWDFLWHPTWDRYIYNLALFTYVYLLYTFIQKLFFLKGNVCLPDHFNVWILI